MNKKSLEKEIDELSDLTRKRIRQETLWMTFLKGALRAIGWTLGLAVIIAITLFVLSRYQHVPVIGQIFIYIKNALGLE